MVARVIIAAVVHHAEHGHDCREATAERAFGHTECSAQNRPGGTVSAAPPNSRDSRLVSRSRATCGSRSASLEAGGRNSLDPSLCARECATMPGKSAPGSPGQGEERSD